MFRFFRVVRIGGVDHRVHWSVALLLLVAPAMPVGVACYVALILLHEHGHAFWARRFGARVESIDLHAFGGFCRTRGHLNDMQRAIFAWGGIVAQLLLLAVALPLEIVLRPHASDAAQQAFGVLVGLNLCMLALNALPVSPLDGADGWALPGLAWRRWRKARTKSKKQRADEIMAEISSLRVGSGTKRETKFDVH